VPFPSGGENFAGGSTGRRPLSLLSEALAVSPGFDGGLRTQGCRCGMCPTIVGEQRAVVAVPGRAVVGQGVRLVIGRREGEIGGDLRDDVWRVVRSDLGCWMECVSQDRAQHLRWQSRIFLSCPEVHTGPLAYSVVELQNREFHIAVVVPRDRPQRRRARAAQLGFPAKVHGVGQGPGVVSYCPVLR
jgi:hypothetical protein